MNAALRDDDVATRASYLGHNAARMVDAIQRRLAWLACNSPTFEQVLLGRVEHGLDLGGLDRTIDEVGAFIEGHGDVEFVMLGGPQPLSEWRDALVSVQASVAPYRKAKR